ncbi:MAG: hypothetical protein P9L99_21595 [Candidatus Lernaella stagnicola]|nr:hypothetical protein [Candidatus Lernaella stagnicola]
MRRIVFLIALLCLLPALAAAQASEARGKIIATTGAALIERPGLDEPIPVDVGFEVFEGDWLVTGQDGHVKILLAGQLVVFLAPNSYLRIKHTIHNLKNRARVSFLYLKSGAVRALVRVRPNYSNAVRLEGPNLVVSSTNAYFFARLDRETGKTIVYNLAGDVRATRPLPSGVPPVDLPVATMVKAEPRKTFSEPIYVDSFNAGQLLADTEIDNRYIWDNRPGAPEYLVERRGRGGADGAAPVVEGLVSAHEGEGGADFDAFRAPGLQQRLRQEDLPRPDNADVFPSPRGFGSTSEDATARIRLIFPDAKDKEDDDD